MSQKKLDYILSNPWGIDEMDKADKDYEVEVERINAELNQVYANCFKTEAGQKVLKHLKKCTLDQPTWIPEAGANLAYSREGQNSIVRNILLRIENAKKK